MVPQRTDNSPPEIFAKQNLFHEWKFTFRKKKKEEKYSQDREIERDRNKRNVDKLILFIIINRIRMNNFNY